MHRRRRLFLGLVFVAASAPGVTVGQAAKQYRIAYLTGYSAEVDKPLFGAFKRGLSELGYVEGRNLVIDARQAEGQPERLPALARELAALRPDIYVVGAGAAAAEAVKSAAGKTPIVMANVQDPVASGLVASLARPGGNITGMSDFHAASVTKRLELMNEAIPGLKLVGVLWNLDSATNARQLKDLEHAAPALGLKILSLPIRKPDDIDGALNKLRGASGAGLLLLGDFVLTTNMKRIAQHAIEQRIPAVYTTSGFIAAGGFMAYGTNFEDLYRRSARFIDRIFKGAKPGDLPIEQPTKFDLIVNLKTAKAIGVNVPRSMLLRADQVIE
jgi:putative tryptophan/tyrosine transport system substrate-binding protein